MTDPRRGFPANHFSAPSSASSSAHDKVMSRDALLAWRESARAAGRAVVQCHGCFDIVHPGHLRHLRHARAQGDLLLVTITGDALISKGDGRPLIPQELRAENLAALDCVDAVFIDTHPTALELLRDVKPDIYVKGREYELNNDPRFKAEQAAVISGGGRVVFSSGDVVFSSTALIAALEQSIDPYHARLRQLLSTPELAGESLLRSIAAFQGKRVVVVGEAILDTYVMCDRPDIAGESPIMTLRPIERRTYDGGAAVIARHLAAMGASPILVTALDDSEESLALRRRLLVEGIEVRAIKVDRPLPEKQRFLIGAQKVMKLDLVQHLEPDAAKQDEFVALVTESLRSRGGSADACILADFGLGLMTQSLLPRLCAAARAHARIVSADVSGKRSNLLLMHNVDLLSPSESELRDAAHLYDQSLSMVAWDILEKTGSRSALVSMGPDGLVAFDRLPGAAQREHEWTTRLKAEHVPAMSPHAIDPLGCGDALLSAATLTLSSGASLLSAGFLGAIAAATQVQRLGNTVVSATDLRHGVARIHAAHLAFSPAESFAPRPSGGRVTGGNWSRLLTPAAAAHRAPVSA